MTYNLVWWPILGICALHLTFPKCTHTAVNKHTPWTHTRSSGQPFMLRCTGSSWGFSALLKGTSVVVLRVERALDIDSPHLQFLPARDSNSKSFDYEPDSLTIRPRLPPIQPCQDYLDGAIHLSKYSKCSKVKCDYWASKRYNLSKSASPVSII